MVACGTSGLLGGRRVFVVFALLVDDNSLIPVVFALGAVFAFSARGLRVVVFFAVAFLAIFISP
jgi:hypothetical protein